MIDSALRQIRMIKFAKRAPMYWRSFMDPDADAFDATRQELMDSYAKLMKNYDAAAGGVKIKDQVIPVSGLNAIFDAAWTNNDTLARARRDHMAPAVYTGLLGGGLVGGGIGRYGGSKLIELLGGGKTAKKWGGRVGMLLGGILGAGVGNRIATKFRSDSLPATLDNGSSVLKQLNDSIANTYSGSFGGSKKLTDEEKNFADITKPDNAVADKLKGG